VKEWKRGVQNGEVEARKGAPHIMRGPHKVSSQNTKVWVKGGRFSP
jgi:hypothetical protein